MPNLLHDHQIADNLKLDPIIARAKSIATCKIPSQRFAAADFRPFPKFFQQPANPAKNRIAQSDQFMRHFGSDLDVCHLCIIWRVDTYINTLTIIDMQIIKPRKLCFSITKLCITSPFVPTSEEEPEVTAGNQGEKNANRKIHAG